MISIKRVYLTWAIVIFCPVLVFSANIYVPGDQPTIQDAINVAVSGDSVLVAPGNYQELITFGTVSIFLVSTGGDDVTFISGSTNGIDVVRFPSGNNNSSTIHGFTIQNANNANGIRIESGNSPQIINCTIRYNTINSENARGGGVYCNGSNVLIRNCLIHDNSNTYEGKGGGIGIGSNGTYITIDSCIIRDNYCQDGGGAIAIVSADNIIITRNLIHGNSNDDDWGGPVYEEYSDYIDIINNTIVNNVSGVSASGRGIAMVQGGYIDIRNNIICTNVNGCELYAINNTGPITAEYNDVYPESYCNVTIGTGSISLPPLFIDSSSGDYGLMPNSPCVDAGDPDIAYNDPDGSRNDMGAYSLILDYPYAVNFNLGDESEDNVVNHSPTFYWTFLDDDGIQNGFEIEVGSDLDWTVAEMWATGEIYSADTEIVYAGNPLIDGETYYVRIRVNDGIEWGDWTHDSFRMNSIPDTPTPYWPINQASVNLASLVLILSNSSDPEGSSLFYDFVVYGDSSLTQLVDSRYNIPEQPDYTQTDLITGLDIDTEYWWRCRAYDLYEYSDWSTTESFITRGSGVINVPGDATTIQEGIDIAADYDTVLVAPGIYNEHINFYGKPIVVKSYGGAPVTAIEAVNPGQHIVTFASNEDYLSVLDGFKITGATSAFGIYIDGSGPTIQNCEICYCNKGGDGAGIWCDGATGIIQYNKVYNNECSMTGAGIGGHGSSNLEIAYNEIYENTADNAPGIGFIAPVSGINIHHNLIRNNIGLSSYIPAGIYINGTDCEIINNTVVNNVDGIHLLNGSNINILNNIVVMNSRAGIIKAAALSDYNDTWNNASDNEPGEHGIGEDPLFNDLENHIYTLLPYSPCIDAGHPDEQYNDPDGTRNDMGAFPLYGNIEYPVPVKINLGSETRTNVINHIPTIYWTFLDTVGAQNALEIEIGTDLDWTLAEMWATGELYSADTEIVYGGNPMIDGETYFMRIRVNNGFEWGNWCEYSFHMNDLPSVPNPSWPTNQTTVPVTNVILILDNSSDIDGGDLSYDFEVYSDASLTQLVASQYGVEEQIPQSISDTISGLDIDTEYWWRCRANDSYEYSDWSSPGSFVTRGPGVIYVPYDITTIQLAINTATEYDTIMVLPGDYYESLNFQGKSILVTSTDGAEVTSISTPGSVARLIEFVSGESPSAELSGFTIIASDLVNAINIGNGAAPTLSRNIIKDYDHDEVAIKCGSNATIKYNLFINNAGISCVGIYSGTATIVNNTFDGNARGFFTISDNGIAYNNIVTNSSAYGVYGDFSAFNYNNIWQNNPNYDGGAGAGSHDISVDPLYNSPASDDYTLQPGSPCIDAGHPDAQYNDPDGSRNDMGAFPLNGFIVMPAAININLGGETRTNVVNHTPTIYWTFFDNTGTQNAFEIEIGTDADWSAAEMWASGEIYSSDTEIVYAGNPLIDGESYFMRMRVNNGIEWGIWVFYDFHMNSIPGIPTPYWPTGQVTIHVFETNLIVNNTFDAENDDLRYDYEIYSDSLLTQLVTTRYGIEEQPGRTESGRILGLDIDAEYWWHCRAHDSFEHSGWSTAESFLTRGSIALVVPTDAATIQEGINMAGPFDTVLVEPGDYYESLDFLGKSVIVIAAGGPEFTTLSTPGSVNELIVFAAGEDELAQFSGFTVIGSDLTNVINISGGASPTISRNVFYNYNGNRVVIECDGGDPTIKYNLFHGNLGISCIGIYSGTAHIINNTFDFNNRGFFTSNNAGVALNNIVSNSSDYGVSGVFNVLDYNNFWQNDPDYYGGATAGSNDLAVDPLYVDMMADDFTLQFISPCVDAGHPDAQYNDPDGSRNDMGAFPLNGFVGFPVAINVNFGVDEVSDHVVNNNPDIYWTYHDTIGSQTKYEVEIGTDFEWSVAEMWASGEVTSTDTFTTYDGLDLIDGETYYYRIRLSNEYDWGGWKTGVFSLNTPPAIPDPIWPTDSVKVHYAYIRLYVNNFTDPENDVLTFDFQLYYDEALTMLADSLDNIEMQDGEMTTVSITAPIDSGIQLYWICRSSDQYEYSDWSSISTFWTRGPGIVHVPAEASSIQLALDNAYTSDTVLVAPGTYTENIDFQGKSILVKSTHGSDSTIIHPSEEGHIIRFTNQEDSSAVLDGFKIRYTIGGSGIFISGAHPIIQNCEISYCVSPGDGGGIYCQASRARIRYNKIHHNEAGGGMLGGGIAVHGSPLLDKLEISYNEIYLNNASDGSGIGGNNVNRLYIHHNVIRDNLGSGSYAGGIYQNGVNINIINNTIVGNTRGVSIAGGNGSNIFNNIIVDNVQEGVIIGSALNDYNDVWHNGSGNDPGTNGISYDPYFIDPEANNYFLQSNSLCIDAGHPDPIYNDPDGSRNDMGAFPAMACGDANGDFSVNILDITFIIAFLYQGGPAPDPEAVADVNGDGSINILDITYLIEYLYLEGPDPDCW